MFRGGGKTLNTSFLDLLAQRYNTDVFPVKRLVDEQLERKKVLETNVGEALLQEISMLKSFDGISVYNDGILEKGIFI